MSEVNDYFPGNLDATLDGTLGWLVERMNANVSPFAGNAVQTPTSATFIEGAIDALSVSYANLAQVQAPNIVLYPLATAPIDNASGPDGFPVNYSPTPLLSGTLFVNVLEITAAATVSGRVLNLTLPASNYRVDVYSKTGAFYYQGSATPAADGTWSVSIVAAGSVIAFLMPTTSSQPAAGSQAASVTGWVAHSNMGVGAQLQDYFVRVYVMTDAEALQEDNIPIMVQDSEHARFGSSIAVASGTPVAHVIYNDPTLGPVDLYSTLQHAAVYSGLPRSMEVSPGDPDFVSGGELTSTTMPALQNRCSIYDAALAIIAFSLAGLWDLAGNIVTRLNDLRLSPGYLPSAMLEDAQDGSTARWSLASGSGSVTNVFDPTEPPAQSGGSNVITFTNTTNANPAVAATWNFAGIELPDGVDSILEWRFKSAVDFDFVVGVTTSTGKITTLRFASSGTSGYDAASKTATQVLSLAQNTWQILTPNLDALAAGYVAGETLTSITSFSVTLAAAGALSLDDLSVGAPKPAGSLSFSYDVYNGQADQITIRSGPVAWLAYAYGIYMERTGDFSGAAAGLQDLLNFLFSLQSTASDLTQNLMTLGWGLYQDPGYQYVPGRIASVSTEDNLGCYFAFDKAARVLPAAAQALLTSELITQAQYDALVNTASNASTKAQEVKNAILNQLWIPAAGSVKGHFAEGASASDLTDSYGLEPSGSWAALFCHETGDDVKAVSSLEFAYENFFLAGQQILPNSTANGYNETYQQLTPFDGFKPYADSASGYAGSPKAIWAEGSWGAIAAYLRLSDNSDLETYFSSAYPGGLASFLTDLVASMATMAGTTSSSGVLSFSLASRALPWEVSVRKTVASTAWLWITASRNDILFTTLTTDFGRMPYLKVPQGVQQNISLLGGTTSIGSLQLEVIDGRGSMTALASGAKLEGRIVSLEIGYPGMGSADFVTVATQQIDNIQILNDATGFQINCTDLKRTAKSQIFLTGDDGSPISKDHPRQLSANPMDICLMVYQNELGLGQAPELPDSAWKIYDPAQWSGDTNPTLITPNPFLDLDQFLFYRKGFFAGYIFEFTLEQAVEAKQFLDYEVFKTLGGYLIVLSDGRLSLRFFTPPYDFSNLFAFNDRNVTALPKVDRQPITNQVTFRMDYDGSKFLTEMDYENAPSLQRFTLAGEDIIESKGIRTARGGAALAGITARRIFSRFSGIDPVTDRPTGGAMVLTVTAQYMTLTVEVGDLVYFSHPLVPNLRTGRRGIFNEIFEVIDKQPDYSKGTMTYKLLDTSWLSSKILSLIAPAGTPPWTAATSAERNRYMFLSSSATGAYSDGTSGKTVW
ncbi:MAG TPA: hypothetical protein VNE63_08355 [Candidatus Acidoferrales bacterium]|nr:hypothetical protein [Candidatus Acidoferrales bacterium]